MSTVETGEPTASLPVHEIETVPVGSALWEEEMPARPVRAKLGRLTIGLLVLAFVAGAFWLGVVTEKHSLSTNVATNAQTAARTGRAGAAATGATGATTGGGSGGATVGQVKLIDGNNIYVTDSTGNVVKVSTTPDSQITVTSSGTAKDVKPGDTVLVTGTTGDDGTVTATAVRDQGAGGAGFGGFGGRRGAGAGGAGGTAGASGAAGGGAPAAGG